VDIPLRFDPADVGGRMGVVRLKQTANRNDPSYILPQGPSYSDPFGWQKTMGVA